MKKTLTVPEVAAELGMTAKAVRQRIARGQLPYRRWGRRVLVLASELEAFLKTLPGTSAEEAATHGEAD